MRTVTRAYASIASVGVSAALLCGCGSSGTVTVQPGSNASGATDATPSGQSSSPADQSSTSTSSDSPDARTLITQTRSAYQSATSGHLHAVIRDGSTTETIDIKGTMDGTNQELTITETGQGTATVRTVSGKHYIKGTSEFWRNGAKASRSTATLLSGRWVKAPATTTNNLSKLTLRNFMTQIVGSSSVSDSELDSATSSTTTYNGQSAYEVKTAKGDTYTLQGSGTRNLLKATGALDSSGTGTAVLDGWNSQPKVAAPSNPVDAAGGASKDT